MKRYLVLLAFLVGCGSPEKEETPLQTVKDFIAWYGNHYQEVTEFKFVNQVPGKNYSVNLPEMRRYFKFLRSSNYISEAYIKSQEKYFGEAMVVYKQDPVNEGPPPGFDFDIVLLTQEPDLVIDKAKDPTVISGEIKNDKAVVKLDVYMKLQFDLTMAGGKWKIDRIKAFN